MPASGANAPRDAGPRRPERAVITGADDRLLVARAADGDVRSFEVLVRRYARLMRAYAWNILGSSDAVDDVVQEAFVIAWQRLESVSDPDQIKSWLMRIVSRRAIDRLRAGHPHDDVTEHEPPVPTSEQPESVTETRMLAAATEDALALLPALGRRCWVLKVVGGYSYRQIADELQLPESTVRGLIARSRATMAREMAAWR